MGYHMQVSSMGIRESLYDSGYATKSSLEKLSSGFRVSKASDDPSGLTIADKLRTEASSIQQGLDNITTGITLTQIADRAMDEQSMILDIIKQKIIQGSSDSTSQLGKTFIADDVNKLLKQLDMIATQTEYADKKLLIDPNNIEVITDTVVSTPSASGPSNTTYDLSGVTLPAGETFMLKDSNGNILSSVQNNSGGNINSSDLAQALRVNYSGPGFISWQNSSNFIVLDGGASVQNSQIIKRDISYTSSGANQSILIGKSSNDIIKLPTNINSTVNGLGLNGLTIGRSNLIRVDEALNKLNEWRADYGSTQKQLESAMKNLATSVTNLKAAESVIRDTDYALESSTFSKANIVQQAGSFALTQANTSQEDVLSYLK
jgi:flagellin